MGKALKAVNKLRKDMAESIAITDEHFNHHLERLMAAKDWLEELEVRVKKLEGNNVTKAPTYIDGPRLEALLDRLELAITALEGRVESLEESMEALAIRMKGLEETVYDLEKGDS